MSELTIDKSKRYLIAVSGGPDSMALFDMVRKSGACIEAAHVNYHKRDTAKRDEDIVRGYCKKYDIPFHLCDFKEEDYSGNFQAAARKARYDFFYEVCKENDLDEVLVAHHKDDLIETYLMQEEKKIGVSYYGLRRDNIIDEVNVCRPLLAYTKKQLLDYCLENDVPYGIDESNLKDDYERNRVRHHKIEKMTEERKDELVRIIEERNEKKKLRYEKAQKALKKGTFTIRQFDRIPYLYEYLSVHFSSLSKAHYREMKRQLLNAKHCVFEGKDIILCKEYGRIEVFEKKADYAYTFDSIDALKGFACEFFTIANQGRKIEGVCLIEKDFPIAIRNARKSDSIELRFGTKKLNRFFIDRKISMKEELSWPVMVNTRNEVIFVSGLGCDINHYCDDPSVFMIKC